MKFTLIILGHPLTIGVTMLGLILDLWTKLPNTLKELYTPDHSNTN